MPKGSVPERDFLLFERGTDLDPRPPGPQEAITKRELKLNQPSGNGKRRPPVPARVSHDGEPDWAGGLRKLYNSVVDEPLPDSFKDLLKKLDGSDNA